MPDAVTAPSAIIKIFSQTAYPSPLNAARSSTDSLRSPTPERLASVTLVARQFLAIAYFANARNHCGPRGADRPLFPYPPFFNFL